MTRNDISRRAALSALFGGAVASIVPQAAYANAGVSIIMISFQGCAACMYWENVHGPEWKKHKLASHVPLRKLEFYRPREQYIATKWPEDIRHLVTAFNADRARFAKNDQADSSQSASDVAPRFMLVHNGVLVDTGLRSTGFARLIQRAEALVAV